MRPRRFFFADIVELHSRTGEAHVCRPPVCRPLYPGLSVTHYTTKPTQVSIRLATDFSGAVPDHSETSIRRECSKTSVLEGHAADVVALELLAGGFGLAFLEPGKARPIECLVAFGHRLGEGIGAGGHALCLALRRGEALLRLAGGLEGADLDDPAAMGLGLAGGRRLRLCGFGGGRGLGFGDHLGFRDGGRFGCRSSGARRGGVAWRRRWGRGRTRSSLSPRAPRSSARKAQAPRPRR